MALEKKLQNGLDKISDLLGVNLRYVFKGGYFLTLGNVASIAANFILAFFFARLLPKETYGTYSYILAWISVLGIFALPGMDTAVIQSVSRGFDSSLVIGLKKKLKYGIWGTLAAIIVGGYYFYGGNAALASAFFVGAAFIPIINGFQIYNAYLLGKKEFKTSAVYSVAGQIFIAAVLVSSVFLTRKVLYIVAAYLAANASVNAFFYIKTEIKSAKTAKDAQITGYAKHLSFMNFIAIIASYADQFLAFHFLGPANLANYAFATSPPEQVKSLFKSLPDLILPKFSERTEEELKKTMTRKIIILTAFTATIVGLYIAIAPLFYKIFFPRYLNAVFLSQIFALSLLNTPPALISGALTAHKKIKKLYAVNIIGPVFQISIMAVLTPLYGLIGLIAARIAARTFNSIISLAVYYGS